MEDLKVKYNKLLERFKKMEKWNETATEEERVKFAPVAVKIIKDMSQVWYVIEDKEEKNMFGGF